MSDTNKESCQHFALRKFFALRDFFFFLWNESNAVSILWNPVSVSIIQKKSYEKWKWLDVWARAFETTGALRRKATQAPTVQRVKYSCTSLASSI